uniref:G-protein coupled receptors family 1 profile domain-containing protein n=1 Tax=Magallana gigas TaxID=29159 RepID=A0A8W8J7H7_MAGGI
MIVKWRPIKVVTYLMRLTSNDSRHYKTTTDGQRQSSRKIFSAMDWFLSTSLAFVLSLPPIFGWTNYSYAPIQSICFSDWAKAPSYAIFMISCCFGCPLFVMLICNLMILREVRRRNRRVMNRKKIHFKAVVNVITGGNNLNRKLTPATFTNIGETSSGGSDTITMCSESEVIEKQVVCSIPLDDLLSKEATNRAFQIQIESTPTVNKSHCKKEKVKKTDKGRISQPPTVSASRSEIHLARISYVTLQTVHRLQTAHTVRGIYSSDGNAPAEFSFHNLLEKNMPGHRITHYKESENIYDVRDVLEKWECPPLNEMNKCIQDIWESLDSHKMNLLTVRNRLARQESTLSKIQETLDKLVELQEEKTNDAKSD